MLFCTYLWSHFKDSGNKLLFDSFFCSLDVDVIRTSISNNKTKLDKKVQYFKMSPSAFLYVLLFAIQLQFYSTNKYISLSFNGYYSASTKTHFVCVTFNVTRRHFNAMEQFTVATLRARTIANTKTIYSSKYRLAILSVANLIRVMA